VTVTAEPAACPQVPEPASRAARRRPGARRVVVSVVAVLVIAGVFGFAFPHFASYRGVEAVLATMSWPQIALIAAAFAVSQLATWLMITAVLPGLPLRRAAVVNLGSTAVANTLPGGGAVAVGVSWAMLSGWGTTTAEFVRYTLVSGVWNVFARLGLPVVALGLLVLAGRSGTALQAAAYAGTAVLLVAVIGLRAVLRSERCAGVAGRVVSAVLAAGCRLLRRPVPGQVPGMVRDFRAGAAGLLAQRGLRITVTTAASQVALWLVLLACLRCSGVSGGQVSWQVSLAAFAFVRLLSVLPLTPGGIGIVELGLVGPMAAGLDAAAAARVAAAVLLYRAVTYLLPIPLGAAAYLGWRYTRRSHPGNAPPARRVSPAAPSGTMGAELALRGRSDAADEAGTCLRPAGEGRRGAGD
jgi:putative heme transporter